MKLSRPSGLALSRHKSSPATQFRHRCHRPVLAIASGARPTASQRSSSASDDSTSNGASLDPAVANPGHMEEHDDDARLVVFSGGTAFNGVAGHLKQLTSRVAYLLPVSDDGGSTAEIVRVLGGPAVGDIRSRCLRLADDGDEEGCAVRDLLAYRLSSTDRRAAKYEWYSIVEGDHPLWKGVSEPYKHVIRAFLVCFHTSILRHSSEQFNFRNGSIGNFFFAGARIFFRSLEAAIFLFSRVARIPLGSVVLPAICTEVRITLGAELENGEVLRGHNHISHPPRTSHSSQYLPDLENFTADSPRSELEDGPSMCDKSSDFQPLPAGIRRVFYLSSEGTGNEHEVFPQANPRALHEIESADAIVYGMGSLYTSICPSLCLNGMGEAISQKHVPKIMCLNGSYDRETAIAASHSGPMTAVDMVQAVTNSLNRCGSRLGHSMTHPPSSYITGLLLVRGTFNLDREALAAMGVHHVVEVDGAPGETAYDPAAFILQLKRILRMHRHQQLVSTSGSCSISSGIRLHESTSGSSSSSSSRLHESTSGSSSSSSSSRLHETRGQSQAALSSSSTVHTANQEIVRSFGAASSRSGHSVMPPNGAATSTSDRSSMVSRDTASPSSEHSVMPPNGATTTTSDLSRMPSCGGATSSGGYSERGSHGAVSTTSGRSGLPSSVRSLVSSHQHQPAPQALHSVVSSPGEALHLQSPSLAPGQGKSGLPSHRGAAPTGGGDNHEGPKLVVFSGGTAFNSVAEKLRRLTSRVAYVLPVSDDGGSTAEIVRVLGGPAVGDIRSRCLRLADDSDDEARAVKELLAHRLPAHDCAAAKAEWHSIVEGDHALWHGVSEPYKHVIRAYLVHFEKELLQMMVMSGAQVFDFRNGSIGNFFFAGARIFFRSLEAAIFLFSRVARLPLGSVVLPAICTEGRITLGAELENGIMIHGQNNISHPPHETEEEGDGSESSCQTSVASTLVDKSANFDLLPAPIHRIFYLSNEGCGQEHEVSPKANPYALQEIDGADAIVFGMGSLYTSICPTLCLDGMGEHIASQNVPKILCLNGSHDRETSSSGAHDGPMLASDIVQAVTDSLNRRGSPAGGRLWNPASLYVSGLLVPRGGSVQVDMPKLQQMGVQHVIEVESFVEPTSSSVYFEPSNLVESISRMIQLLSQGAVPVCDANASVP